MTPPAGTTDNGRPAAPRTVANAMVTEGNALMKEGRVAQSISRTLG